MKLWSIPAIVLLALVCQVGPATAESIPHAGKKAQNHYEGKYNKARKHKAFVIAPGGGWQWKGGKSSPEAAIKAAMDKCQKKNSVCVVYDVDGKKVFDENAWSSALAPYPPASEAASASVGAHQGDKFPDLSFETKDGVEKSISDYRGKVVFLNVWASWCPPCQTEMPSLDALYEKFKGNPDVEFLMVATREASSKSYDYIEWKKYGFPVYHTGVSGKKNKSMPLRGGDTINQDKIGKYIPFTVVLDRNGIVVFKKVKGFDHWQDFDLQLAHIIQNSGQ